MSNHLPCCTAIIGFYIKHLIIFVLTSNVIHSQATISCHYEINLSLGNNCQFQLTPQHILSNGNSSGPYTLMVTTGAGDVIPNNLLDYSHISDRLTAKVTNADGNSCWGHINVEDKTRPVISCVDHIISCYEDTAPLPTAQDACTTTELVLVSEDINSLECDDDFLSNVIQVFQATDAAGNRSTCSQNISVERFDASSIIWPPDTTLNCNDPFLVTGLPTLAGSVVSLADLACNLDIGYTDVFNTTIGCPTEILRTWMVNETHCDTIVQVTHLQTIEIVDNIAPIINCPTDLSVQANNVDCSATFELQLPLITDDCSGVLRLDISYATQFLNDVTTNPIITIGENTTINYIAYDRCGNLSNCSTDVIITNILSPGITCPANVTVACDDPLLDDLSNFGSAVASGGCSALTTTEGPPDSFLNSCGIGLITRNFSSVSSGTTLSCQQIIQIDQIPAFNSSRITCPMETIIVDADVDVFTLDTGSPILDLTGINCSDIIIDFEVIKIGDLPCGEEFSKIWIIEDVCTNEVGLCFQIIQAVDESNTTLTCPDVEVTTTDCDENFLFLDLPISFPSICGGAFTATNNSFFAFDNDSPNAQGFYPIGTHSIMVSINASGVISTCNYTVTVLDGLDFIINCKAIIETVFPGTGGNPPRGLVEIDQACVDFDPNCVPAEYSSSFDPNDINATSFYVDCDDLGLNFYSVYLWRDGLVVDSCMDLIQVLDGLGICTTPVIGEISGSVHTEDNQMIPNVRVDLDGHRSAGSITDKSGHYAYDNVAFDQEYEIIPSKTDDQLNGLSTLDLILIQRHILGMELLDSPYKIIAADINRSNHVSGVDLVELRKLILGISSEEQSSISWRMIDASHEFIDEKDPFLSILPETYPIENLDSQMEIDFIGVKLGDVNSSVKLADRGTEVSARRSTEFSFELEEKQHLTGELADLSISISELSSIDGFQFSLNIDPSLAKLISVNSTLPEFDENNYHINRNTKGPTNISWFPSAQNKSTAEDHNIIFKVEMLEDAKTSDLIKLTSDGLEPEVYIERGIQKLTLEYNSPPQIELLQNIPNPWSTTTEIKFQLSDASDVLFKVYTSAGKLVHQKSINGTEGVNSIILSKGDFDNEGLYFYELSHGKERVVRKMLIGND